MFTSITKSIDMKIFSWLPSRPSRYPGVPTLCAPVVGSDPVWKYIKHLNWSFSSPTGFTVLIITPTCLQLFTGTVPDEPRWLRLPVGDSRAWCWIFLLSWAPLITVVWFSAQYDTLWLSFSNNQITFSVCFCCTPHLSNLIAFWQTSRICLTMVPIG